MKASIAASLFGILILFLSCLLLWNNEGRAIKTARGLAEGSAAVISVVSTKANPENETKLVHLSGDTVTGKALEDAAFGIKRPALRLARKVEMYQWKEKSETSFQETNNGKTGTTVYTYDKVWDEKPIDSAAFNQPLDHINPTPWRFSSDRWVAKDAHIGAFQLPESLVGKLEGEHKLALGETDYALQESNPPQLRDGGLYFGANPLIPAIGDLRVNWQILDPGPYSVVGRQSGSSITPYPTKAGTQIELVATGNVPAVVMFEQAVKENIALTWGMRIFGTLFMFAGIRLLFNPLAGLGRVVPFISRLLQAGITLFCAVLAAMVSLVVMGSAWFAYRPLLTIVLLVVAAALGIGVGMKYRKTAIG
ncbi:MAG: TMEM43 family protein [Roseimicrobium sp.]